MTLPPAFRRQWLASGISNIGDGMDAAAGPLLAASLTNDPRLIALVGVGLTLPWLVNRVVSFTHEMFILH